MYYCSDLADEGLKFGDWAAQQASRGGSWYCTPNLSVFTKTLHFFLYLAWAPEKFRTEADVRGYLVLTIVTCLTLFLNKLERDEKDYQRGVFWCCVFAVLRIALT